MHSNVKIDFLYHAMMADNDAYLGVMAYLRDTRPPWDNKSIPDHSRPAKHIGDVSDE